MNDAGSLDAAKIRDAIKALNEPMTPFGPVHFDAGGQNQHPVLITQVQAGQYKVVFPTDAADGKPVIPAPKWS
jgi:branched-chain amino acid transport system substrate-binding protein